MTFRDFLAVMAVGAVAAWAAWIVVLVSIDPVRAGVSAIVFFYLTLAVALFGTLACAGSGIRAWAKPQELPIRQVGPAFRQAGLITIVVLGTLMLSSAGVLRWWTQSLVLLAVALIELASLASTKSNRPNT